MKQMTLKNRTIGMIFAATMVFCMTLGTTPSSAEDRVVVIPMGKSGAPAPVAKTGQTISYATGDDGDLEKGVGTISSRFKDNNNGTVTDKLTGLIWLKEGQCSTFFSGDLIGRNIRSWAQAIEAANKLATGYCELTDGSKAGDWRLPNVNEFASLIDRGQSAPPLPAGCPLTESTAMHNYWSSTTLPDNTNYAWLVGFHLGYYDNGDKVSDCYVRVVRGGQ